MGENYIYKNGTTIFFYVLHFILQITLKPRYVWLRRIGVPSTTNATLNGRVTFCVVRSTLRRYNCIRYGNMFIIAIALHLSSYYRFKPSCRQATQTSWKERSKSEYLFRRYLNPIIRVFSNIWNVLQTKFNSLIKYNKRYKCAFKIARPSSLL